MAIAFDKFALGVTPSNNLASHIGFATIYLDQLEAITLDALRQTTGKLAKYIHEVADKIHLSNDGKHIVGFGDSPQFGVKTFSSALSYEYNGRTYEYDPFIKLVTATQGLPLKDHQKIRIAESISRPFTEDTVGVSTESDSRIQTQATRMVLDQNGFVTEHAYNSFSVHVDVEYDEKGRVNKRIIRNTDNTVENITSRYMWKEINSRIGCFTVLDAIPSVGTEEGHFYFVGNLTPDDLEELKATDATLNLIG